MLSWLVSAALAANSWTPSCTAANDPSVWFLFTQAADAPPSPEYECKGIFFDNIPCTQTIGLGKIAQTGLSSGGYALHELRYLPNGDIQKIMTFLNVTGGGVLYKPPVQPAASPAATPPPPKTEDLMRGYLTQRNKASAATKNVTLHVWYCPDSSFFMPTDVTEPVGIKVVEHIAKAP